MRIWIYTDAATYEEIDKVLSPMVSRSAYLEELDRVLDGGIAPAKRKRLESNVTLDMIADFRCGVGGLNRALPLLWKKDSKKLLAALPIYAKSWTAESPSSGPQMVANLAHYLGQKKDPKLRQTSRQILNQVPASMRARVVDAGGLEAVSVGVFSKDKVEIKETLDLLVAYNDERYASAVTLGQGRLSP